MNRLDEKESKPGPAAARGAFRSLKGFNYRTWALGAIVSNVGTWMQRTAQDWLVLTQLSKNQNATAVGVVMALQFGPQVLLLPWTGYAADHLDRRKLLFATQAALGLLALGLGLLTVFGMVQLWHVYLFAFLLGCVTAFDSPTRQAFVSELVVEEDLPNAVGLNSTSFNIARMVGPAIAGVLIASFGSGWVFLINAASFVAVLISLYLLRPHELHLRSRPATRGSLLEGFRYVWKRPDLKAVLLMIFFFGAFGLNFAIFLSTMAVKVFHKGAGQFGLLTSIMAVGSVTGALLAATRAKPRMGNLIAGAAAFGTALAIAALMPSYALFAVPLMVVGLSAQTLTTSANSVIQLACEPHMRGRVVAIFLAVALGGTPIGAPIVGWVADTFGPRWSLGLGALAGFGAALVGIIYLFKYNHLRVRFESGRLRFSFEPAL